MTDYIQVPVDLLSELAESLACELDARYPETIRSYEWKDREYQAEMEPVLTARRIIAAAPDHIADARKMVAPAVQGEPVGWVWHSYNQTNFTAGSHHKEVLEEHGVKLTPVYTAPQPAEQQSEPDVVELVEALEQCITSMLDSGYRANAVVIRAARAALAAHRKQGSE